MPRLRAARSLELRPDHPPNQTIQRDIGVGRDPREEVGMAPIYGEAHINWVRPGRPLVGEKE